MNRVPLGNQYNKYDSKNPVTKWLMTGFLEAFDRATDVIERPDSVLEIGCGDGVMLERVRRRWKPMPVACGLDLGFEELKRAMNRAQASCFTQASCGAVPFRDRCHDLVLALEVLEHLTDIRTGLEELDRVGRRDFIISVLWEPVWRIGNVISGRYIQDLGNTPGHVQHWSRRAILRLLDEYFRIVMVLKPFPWTMVVCRKKD